MRLSRSSSEVVPDVQSRPVGTAERSKRWARGSARVAGRCQRHNDHGVATVYACLGVVIMLAVLGLALQLGAATLARQRAETGADLAALAGAAKVLQGPGVVCAKVVAIATANEVAVDSCTVNGTDVLVIVRSQVNTGPISGSATGRARAGPVGPVGEATG